MCDQSRVLCDGRDVSQMSHDVTRCSPIDIDIDIGRGIGNAKNYNYNYFTKNRQKAPVFRALDSESIPATNHHDYRRRDFQGSRTAGFQGGANQPPRKASSRPYITLRRRAA